MLQNQHTRTPKLTDEELETLLDDAESDRVKRKRSAADRNAIRRTICAFANDMPGYSKPGVIFVGIEDDGSCANIDISDDLLSTLAQMRSDGNIYLGEPSSPTDGTGKLTVPERLPTLSSANA